jgi:hypothetical protein
VRGHEKITVVDRSEMITAIDELEESVVAHVQTPDT